MTLQSHRNASYPETSDEPYIALIKVEADELPEPLYFTDAAGSWDDTLNADVLVVGGITYFCAPFVLQEPGQGDREEPGKLLIPNVDERIGAALESLSNPPRLTLTIALESDPATAIDGPYAGLLWNNIKLDALVGEGDLMLDDMSAEPFPREWIAESLFPGAYL